MTTGVDKTGSGSTGAEAGMTHDVKSGSGEAGVPSPADPVSSDAAPDVAGSPVPAPRAASGPWGLAKLFGDLRTQRRSDDADGPRDDLIALSKSEGARILTPPVQRARIVSLLDFRHEDFDRELKNLVERGLSIEAVDALYVIYHYDDERVVPLLKKLFTLSPASKINSRVFLTSLSVFLKKGLIASPERLGHFLNQFLHVDDKSKALEFIVEMDLLADEQDSELIVIKRKTLAYHDDWALLMILGDELTPKAIRGLYILFLLSPSQVSPLLAVLKKSEARVASEKKLNNLFLEAYFDLYRGGIRDVRSFLKNEVADAIDQGTKNPIQFFNQVIRIAELERARYSEGSDLGLTEEVSTKIRKVIRSTGDHAVGTELSFGFQPAKVRVRPVLYDAVSKHASTFIYFDDFDPRFSKFLRKFMDLKSKERLIVSRGEAEVAKMAAQFYNWVAQLAAMVERGIAQVFELHFTSLTPPPAIILTVIHSIFGNAGGVRFYWYPTPDAPFNEGRNITSYKGLSRKSLEVLKRIDKKTGDRSDWLLNSLSHRFLPGGFSLHGRVLEDLHDLAEGSEEYPFEATATSIGTTKDQKQQWHLIRRLNLQADQVAPGRRVANKRAILVKAYPEFAESILHQLDPEAIRGLFYIFLGGSHRITGFLEKYSSVPDRTPIDALNLLLKATAVLADADLKQPHPDAYRLIKIVTSQTPEDSAIKAHLNLLVRLAHLVEASRTRDQRLPFTNLSTVFDFGDARSQQWVFKPDKNVYMFETVHGASVYADAWDEESKTVTYVFDLDSHERFLTYLNAFFKTEGKAPVFVSSQYAALHEKVSVIINRLLGAARLLEGGLANQVEIHVTSDKPLPDSFKRAIFESGLFKPGKVRLIRYENINTPMSEAEELKLERTAEGAPRETQASSADSGVNKLFADLTAVEPVDESSGPPANLIDLSHERYRGVVEVRKVQVTSVLKRSGNELHKRIARFIEAKKHVVEVMDPLSVIYCFQKDLLLPFLEKLFRLADFNSERELPRVFLNNLFLLLKTGFLSSPKKLGTFIDYFLNEGTSSLDYLTELDRLADAREPHRAQAKRELLSQIVEHDFRDLVQDELTPEAVRGLNLLFLIEPRVVNPLLHRLQYVQEQNPRLSKNLANLFLQAFPVLYTSEVDQVRAYLEKKVLSPLLTDGKDPGFFIFHKVAWLAEYARFSSSDAQGLKADQILTVKGMQRRAWSSNLSDADGDHYSFVASSHEIHLRPLVWDASSATAVKFNFTIYFRPKFLSYLEMFLVSAEKGQEVLVDRDATRLGAQAARFYNSLLAYARAVDEGVIKNFELHITTPEPLPSLIRRVLDSLFVKPETARLYWYARMDTPMSEAKEIPPRWVQLKKRCAELSPKAQAILKKISDKGPEFVEIIFAKLSDIYLPKPFLPAIIFLEDLFELDEAQEFPEGSSLDTILNSVLAPQHYNETWRIVRRVNRWADHVDREGRIQHKRDQLAHAYPSSTDLIRTKLDDAAIRALYYIFLGDNFKIDRLFDRFSEFSSEEVRNLMSLLLRATDVLIDANLAHFDSDFFGMIKGLIKAKTLFRVRAQVDRIVVLARLIEARQKDGLEVPFTNLNKLIDFGDIPIKKWRRQNGDYKYELEYGDRFSTDAWNEKSQTAYFIHSVEADDDFVEYFELFLSQRNNGYRVFPEGDSYAHNPACYFTNRLLQYSLAMEKGFLKELEIHLTTKNKLPESVREAILKPDLFPPGTVRFVEHLDMDSSVDEVVGRLDDDFEDLGVQFSQALHETNGLLARMRSSGESLKRSPAMDAAGGQVEPEAAEKEPVMDVAEEESQATAALVDAGEPAVVADVSRRAGEISADGVDVLVTEQVPGPATVVSALHADASADVQEAIAFKGDQEFWDRKDKLIMQLIEAKAVFDIYVKRLEIERDEHGSIEEFLAEALDESSLVDKERLGAIESEFEEIYEEVIFWKEIHAAYTQENFVPHVSSQRFLYETICFICDIEKDDAAHEQLQDAFEMRDEDLEECQEDLWAELGPWAKKFVADELAALIDKDITDALNQYSKNQIFLQSNAHWGEIQRGFGEIPSVYAQLYFLSYLIHTHREDLRDEEHAFLIDLIETLTKNGVNLRTWTQLRDWADDFLGLDSSEIDELVHELIADQLIKSTRAGVVATFLPPLSQTILAEYYHANRLKPEQQADFSSADSGTPRGGQTEGPTTAKGTGDQLHGGRKGTSKKKGGGGGSKETNNHVSGQLMGITGINTMMEGSMNAVGTFGTSNVVSLKSPEILIEGSIRTTPELFDASLALAIKVARDEPLVLREKKHADTAKLALSRELTSVESKSHRVVESARRLNQRLGLGMNIRSFEQKARSDSRPTSLQSLRSALFSMGKGSLYRNLSSKLGHRNMKALAWIMQNSSYAQKKRMVQKLSRRFPLARPSPALRSLGGAGSLFLPNSSVMGASMMVTRAATLPKAMPLMMVL